jgi:hypothetical protein
MTRLELLKIVVSRARANGFEFRRWYTGRMGLPWISGEAAVTLLDSHRRYYALLYSHEFAQAFWKPGETITFAMPEQSFESLRPDGTVKTFKRKRFMRRSSRPDAWKYHLREMTTADDPLRYLRRYLKLDDEEHFDDNDEAHLALVPEVPKEPVESLEEKTRRARGQRIDAALKNPKPVSTEPPAFLRRPYP